MSILDKFKPAAEPRERPALLARLGLTSTAVGSRDLIFEGARFGKKAVGDSEDLQRILEVPRRAPPSDMMQKVMAIEMTRRLRRDNPRCRCAELRPGVSSPCITELMPVQGWYLYEAAQAQGVVGHIVAGGGKTGIGILLPMVIPGCRRALMMLQPNLRGQFRDDLLLWSQHFNVPNLSGGRGFVSGRPTIDVLAYSELSHESCATWLQANKPDLIVCDEAQNLKARDSVRTSRFLRHFIDSEETKLFVHSGSMTTRTLDDYGHLSALALREGSPLPLDMGTLREWCGALDPSPSGSPMAPLGKLRLLCNDGESVRSGFRRRLVDTLGVITTADAQVGVKLRIISRDPGPIPDRVKEALAWSRKGTRPDWLAPDGPKLAVGEGEELLEQMQAASLARQVSSGFFYRWKYPRGEPEELILEWFRKRQAWNRELRTRLEHRSELLDSPGLLKDAALRAMSGYVGELPTWKSDTFPAWFAISDQVQPEQSTVWIDDFLARDAVAWGNEKPGVIWYRHRACGEAVARLGGFPLFGEGTEASDTIKLERGDRTIVASIEAHGTGKNLQMFSRGLVMNPPSDGGKWEQLLARFHRHGQEKPCVDFYVYRHTPEMAKAMDSALEFARYTQETTGKVERLLYADFVGDFA